MSGKILIADDDPEIRMLLRIALEQAGFRVIHTANGRAALRAGISGGLDLMILDIGMPEMDGLEVCRRLRAQTALPVLFLTARDEEIDRVLGFELGGDDYVTKPFSPRELVARVKAILNRSTGRGGVELRAQSRLRHGELALDPAGHICMFGDREITLTATEFTLLGLLMAHPDQIHARPRLADRLHGQASGISDRTLDSHLRNLRRKLAEAGCRDGIVTVHGVGIRMGACTDR